MRSLLVTLLVALAVTGVASAGTPKIQHKYRVSEAQAFSFKLAQPRRSRCWWLLHHTIFTCSVPGQPQAAWVLTHPRVHRYAMYLVKNGRVVGMDTIPV